MYDECEILDFYHEKTRRARVAHKCCECSTPITPGDSYVACSGKYEGNVFVEKQHLVCWHIARFVNLDLFAHWHHSDEPGLVRKHQIACVPFGEIGTALSDAGEYCDEEVHPDGQLPFGVENCVDVQAYWDRWLHDVHETFADGAGV
jgi:hypothetical protein